MQTDEIKGLFSFTNDNIIETVLPNGVILRIERSGFAIARVYFVNVNFSSVSIPDGLVVFDVTNNVHVKPLPNTQTLALAWTDGYRITFNGELIVELNTTRQWSVHGPAAKVVHIIES